MSQRHIPGSILVMLMIGLMPVAGSAMIIQMSLPELVSQSDVIVRGEVTTTECRWVHCPYGRIIVTDVTVAVGEPLMGSLDQPEVVIEVPGGVVGDLGLRVADAPQFTVNEEIMAFLSPVDGFGHRAVTNLHNGKYTIRDQLIEETGEPVSEFTARVNATVKAWERRQR